MLFIISMMNLESFLLGVSIICERFSRLDAIGRGARLVSNSDSRLPKSTAVSSYHAITEIASRARTPAERRSDKICSYVQYLSETNAAPTIHNTSPNCRGRQSYNQQVKG